MAKVEYTVSSGILEDIRDKQKQDFFMPPNVRFYSTELEDSYILYSQDGYFVTHQEWELLKTVIDAGYQATIPDEILADNLETYQKRLEEQRRPAATSAIYSVTLPESLPPRKYGPKAGWVYLIRADSKQGFKIGMTTNKLRERIKQNRSTLHSNVDCLHAIPTENAQAAESACHSFWADKRITGEWFDLTEQDVLLFCSQADDSLFLNSLTQESV